MPELHIAPEVILYYVADGSQDDLSDFVQSIVFNNDINVPVATATIILNPANDRIAASSVITSNSFINYWRKKIKLNSVISFKIDRKTPKHTFLGFVDQVFPQISVSAKSNQKVLVLNCSLLLPKLLLRDEIINSPYLSSNQKIVDALGDRTKFFGWSRGLTKDGTSPFVGTPENAVKYILENVPATQVEMSGDFSARSFFSGILKDTNGKSLMDFTFLNGEYLFSIELSMFAGNILNYIWSCVDKDFYLIYFDGTTSQDGLPRVKMVIKPKPFSFKQYNSQVNRDVLTGWPYFEDLPTHTITKEDRLNETLGISDYELKNYFVINFQNSLLASASSYLSKFGLSFPVVNLDGIKKFGLRPLTVTSTLINYKKIVDENNKAISEGQVKGLDQITEGDLTYGNNTMLSYLLAKREKVIEFHAFPWFESGQLIIPLDETIRIGERLFFQDKFYYNIDTDQITQGVYYFINGTSHYFNYGSFAKSTLRLTRGAPDGVPATWLNKYRPNFVSIDTLGEVQTSKLGNQINEDLQKQNIFDLPNAVFSNNGDA